MRRALVAFACMLAFAQSRGQVGCSPFGDLNGDSLVTILDLMSLLGVYGVDYTTQTPGEECQPVTWNGYTYDVVQIGEQCWFAENLRTQLYQNGDSIVNDPELCPNPDGSTCQNIGNWPEYCSGCGMFASPQFPDSWGSEVDAEDVYGLMYNRAAVGDPRKVCPTGWTMATNDDYNYVCGWYADQSGNLYTNGLAIDGSGGWNFTNWYGEDYIPPCATNFSGLDLRPGGYVGFGSFPGFYAIGSYGEYWKLHVDYSNYTEGDRYVTKFRITPGCNWCPGSGGGDDAYTGGYVRCIKD